MLFLMERSDVPSPSNVDRVTSMMNPERELVLLLLAYCTIIHLNTPMALVPIHALDSSST